jgi:hypothetical protein
MRKSNHHAIRMLLQQHHDGLRVAEIAERLDKYTGPILRSLHGMPDAYIDRWVERRKQWSAVWCVIVPPPHCPKPNLKPAKRKEINGHTEFRSMVQ